MNKNKSYLLPILMMFALFFMIAFVTGLPAPFGVIVKNQFGATDFMSTLGFFANFIAYTHENHRMHRKLSIFHQSYTRSPRGWR